MNSSQGGSQRSEVRSLDLTLKNFRFHKKKPWFGQPGGYAYAKQNITLINIDKTDLYPNSRFLSRLQFFAGRMIPTRNFVLFLNCPEAKFKTLEHFSLLRECRMQSLGML